MTRLTYVLQFRRAAKSEAQKNPVAIASSLNVRTTIGAEGVTSEWEPLVGETATMENTAVLNNDGTLFFEWGTIQFGSSSLTFSSVGAGSLLGATASDGFNQGVVMWKIDGGTGFFQGATGAIVSNFLIDLKTDELIDTQCHVIELP